MRGSWVPAKPPVKVLYTEDPNETQIKWGGCADPRGVLTPGEWYELERIEIHSWHTKVFLKDIDCGRGFNSVSFNEGGVVF